MANIANDIKSILKFYQLLGFDMLPMSSKSDKFSLSAPRLPLEKETVLKVLQEEIGNCKRCKLSEGRTNIVFGEGNPDTKIMFIGEAPGREEDIQARPFVGDAGMLLTRLIEKMGFQRKDVYIANIVKCRPPMNREPDRDEIERCRGFIEKQIEIIYPEIIVSLGRISAQTLIGSTELKMKDIRGNLFDYKGITLIPTFHPAYLLRNPKDKWLTWSDAQKVLDILKGKAKSENIEVT